MKVILLIASLVMLVQFNFANYIEDFEDLNDKMTIFDKEDDDFLDELERATFLFFWEQADENSGQIKDRAFANGNKDYNPVASIASTGFGLAGLAIAHKVIIKFNY